MTAAEFDNLVSRIFTYFQKREPEQKVLDLWYQDCSNLNAAARETIYEYFKKLEKFPTNFCYALKQGYGLWVHDNPQAIDEARQPCDKRFRCDSGFITAWYFDNRANRVQRVAVKCACKGGKPYDVFQSGYLLQPYFSFSDVDIERNYGLFEENGRDGLIEARKDLLNRKFKVSHFDISDFRRKWNMQDLFQKTA